MNTSEGIPEDQWCYPRSGPGSSCPRTLERTGYRLPTEAEWEYACRARAATIRRHSAGESRLANTPGRRERRPGHAPAGRKQPNDLGLFDMLGNASEWCSDAYRKYPANGVVDDVLEPAEFSEHRKQVLRRGDVQRHRVRPKVGDPVLVPPLVPADLDRVPARPDLRRVDPAGKSPGGGHRLTNSQGEP